ncbi:hypothetical protein FE324_00665 [Dolosigranulum pigrum]|jgi:hypothetical protein|uniref:hypothetical protein n=1 Tax=Dolosigranulum pigrum TaxID=29394 RepID=UPI001AD87721|nr:hypothetical protein [Dolosigranulum pigrum]QTJ37357.1 hypothetical protein FE324_00665 [Dolosigranulum pigrum]
MTIEQFFYDSTIENIILLIGLFGPLIHVVRTVHRMNQITVSGKPSQWKRRLNIGYSIFAGIVGVVYAVLQKNYWELLLGLVIVVIVARCISVFSYGFSRHGVYYESKVLFPSYGSKSYFFPIRSIQFERFDKITELGDYSLIKEQDQLIFKFHDHFNENELIFDLKDKEKIERILSNHNMIDA